MDTSESGDDLGTNFITVDSQQYMVQEELDGKCLLAKCSTSQKPFNSFTVDKFSYVYIH